MLGDSTFTEELKRASIYIQDRRVFYSFLYNKTEKEYLEVFDEQPTPNPAELLEIDYAANISYQLDTSDDSDGDELLSDLAETFRRKSPRRKKESLVDKFLKNGPLLELDEEGNVTIDDSPSEKEEEFVSETLANIYARQGYYEKAIEVFEKLSLKYPEKSIYFAGQIGEIKKLKNN